MRGPLAHLGRYAQDLLENHRLGYRRYLVPEERRVFAVRRHWAILVRPLSLLAAAGSAAGAALWFLPPSLGLVKEVSIWVCFALVGYSLWQAFEWRTERFVATGQRVLLTQGLLYRRVGTLPLAKVTDLSYERSVLGRVFGYGTFVFESAGQEQAMRRVTWVPCPDVTYRLLVADMFATAPDPADVEHMTRRMSRYDDLSDLGDGAGGPADGPGPGTGTANDAAADLVGAARRDEPGGADDWDEGRSRPISVTPPHVVRAETLFRSSDLRGAREALDTGPVRYYGDSGGPGDYASDGTQDPPGRG